MPVHLVVLPIEHWPQAPLGWQAGVTPPHSPSPAQARQACVVVLQTGVIPPQVAFVVQGTHVAVATSQAGVVPVHLVALVAEQIPQAPPGWQAGVAPPHSASAAQARQACDVVLQTGVVPPHWAVDVQGTQVPAPVKHTGVAPLQLVALVAEH